MGYILDDILSLNFITSYPESHKHMNTHLSYENLALEYWPLYSLQPLKIKGAVIDIFNDVVKCTHNIG